MAVHSPGDTGLAAWGTGVDTRLDGLDVGVAARPDRAEVASSYMDAVVVVGFGIDPSGATDSTSAIQAVIDAHPGRTLYLPAGVYQITGLTVSKSQHLMGAGWSDYRDRFDVFGDSGWLNPAFTPEGTVLRSTITTGAAITMTDTLVGTGGRLSELVLIGPGTGTSTGIILGGTAVGSTATHPIWRNVKVGNFATGVLMRWVNEGSFYDLTIHGCTTGLNLSSNVNQNAFYMLDAQRNTTGVIIASTCVANAFYSPLSQRNGTGFTVDGYKNALYNPYFEASGSYAVNVVGGFGHRIDAPFGSAVADVINIASGPRDVSITGFGYGTNSSPIVNAGTRTYLQGNFTGVLTDTGTGTIVIGGTAAGTAFGAWGTYAPTLAGTGWALGNGTASGKVTRIGNTVHFSARFTFGSTSTFGTVSPTVTYPTTLAGSSLANVTANLTKSGTGYFGLIALAQGTTSATLYSIGSSGAAATLSATVPATLASGDVLTVYGTYESA